MRRRFMEAVDALVGQVKEDRSVLAAILCGSLSHDTVWDKSDVDLVFVTMDDRKIEREGISLYADGVNVHALLIPRTGFRSWVEGSRRQSFSHSFLAKGRLLYSHDPSVSALFAALRDRGERDTMIQRLRAATSALPPLYKAHKWFRTRDDLEYAALWILYTARALAELEVMNAGLLVDREALPQALKLNPDFFHTIYTDLLNQQKSASAVKAALDAIDEYLGDRASLLFAPILEHLRDAGEARSCTEIEDYFARTFAVEGVTTACEYLADRGLLGKASVTSRLTKRSSVDVQELAFFSI